MVTITVSEEFAARFREVANQGIDPEELILDLLTQREAEEAVLLTSSLTNEDIAAIQEAVDALPTEKGMPWEEYTSQQRANREERRRLREASATE